MSTLYPSTKAAITALTELGFRARTRKIDGITQYKDFKTLPVVIRGERRFNIVVFYSYAAEDRFREVTDQFVARTKELGSEWTVQIDPRPDGRRDRVRVTF